MTREGRRASSRMANREALMLCVSRVRRYPIGALPRCYVSVAVLDGCIYAMGGYDGHVRQNTAERYTPRSNQWSLITPMNHQRSDASATTLNS